MTRTPSSNEIPTCDYQIADWGQPEKRCERAAVKASFHGDSEQEFFYCKAHFEKAEPFLASRCVPVSDV